MVCVMYIIPSVYDARDSHKFRVLAAIMKLFIGEVDLGINSYYTDGTQTKIFLISYCFYWIFNIIWVRLYRYVWRKLNMANTSSPCGNDLCA